MGSDTRSSGTRHRFGFSGPITREKKDRITTDDILDSLTRQAELRQKLGERDQVKLEEIAGAEGAEDLRRSQGFIPEPTSDRVSANNRSLGQLAFVFMLLFGLIVVWLYSSISKPFDLALLNGIIQKSGIQSVFANQAQLGISALAALLGALWIRHKRRGFSAQVLSG